MQPTMDASSYAFTHGVRHTRATLRTWQRTPWAVLARWTAGSALAAGGLLLAVWAIASRRGEWEQLLAATLVTVAVAMPVLVVSAFVEVYVSPHLFSALTDLHPIEHFAGSATFSPR